MSRTMKFLLYLLLAIIVVGAIAYIGLQNDPRNVAAPTQAPYTINGENGVIHIPGTAYIEAFDPATNSNIDNINIWTQASSGVRLACSTVDGDMITVDGSTETDGRTWLHVTHGSCSGWILTEFVTPSSS
jgi:hypothetical protein